MVEPASPRYELEPSDIRRIRESLGLSQVEAGELLGGGPRAFAKYENGVVRPAASVTNLLRLLEANPTALVTLAGRKGTPIDYDSARPLEVTDRHIAALSDRKFANLVRRLLGAEAQKGDLPTDGIHVAAKITASDGGEDARIEWKDGPDRTAFLPSRLTQFQLKATEVSPKEAGDDILTADGDIQPMVGDVLKAGGAYVMLCSRSYTNDRIKKRSKRLLDVAISKGLKVEASQIQFRDASQIAQWVNTCPPVAAWVLEQTQPGLAGPFRDWTHWAGRFEHENSPWVADPRLAPFRDKLHPPISTPRGVVRVVGLSGVGKSRLVLEALASDADSENAALSLSDLVLYANESESTSAELKSTVQNLVDASIRAIVVVDRCVADTHQDLAAMVKRSGSRLSLVTIDHEVPSAPRPHDSLLVDKADDSVINSMLKRVAPGLPGEDHQRLVKFSAGLPQMILLLGQAWLKEAPIAAASDAELVDRIIYGRKPINRALQEEAGMILGAFGLLGIVSPLTDLEEIISLTRSKSGDDLRAAFDEFCERGIVQRRGRLITLQPRPIALALAERQWRRWSKLQWDAVLGGKVPEHLRRRAARQLSLLNDRPIAADVTRYVCRVGGPFSSISALSLEGNTQVLSSLAEIDSETVATLLEDVFSQLSDQELIAVRGDVRRYLVRALEKIAFMSSTFEPGARLLMRLAVAENETWANNASGQFKALFPVFLADTEAAPTARLRVLDEIIEEDSPQQMPLLVDALLAGSTTSHYSRMVGPEIHGSRPAHQPWKPKLWKDAWDYITACLDRLVKLARRSDEIGSRARNGFGHQLRGLVSRGLIDQVERWIADVVAVHSYWPEALDALGDVLQYDDDHIEPDVIERVRVLITKLTPNDIASRVRFLVTEMPWDYPGEEKLEFEERRKRQIELVEELARELLNEPHLIERFLPQLSVNQQRMAYVFGCALAKLSEEPECWCEPVIKAVESVAEEHRNLSLAIGYLSTLANTNPKIVEDFKRDAINSKTFAPALPAICSCIGITRSDIALVCQGLRGGAIPPASVADWTMGGVLAKLPSDAVRPLFDQMFTMGPKAYSVALDLMGMYVHGNIGRLDELRPQLKLAASQARIRPKSHGSQMDAHHFKELMEWILAKGREDGDARSIATILTQQLVDKRSDSAREFLKPLMPTILSKFGSIVWPILGQAIVSNPARAWEIEHILNDPYSFGEQKKPALLELSEDILFSWCHAHPDIGPEFVAGITPLLASENPNDAVRTFHPIALRLLDEFGDRDGVLRKLHQNMHTFGWAGSVATYYALYEQPLRSLESHKIGAVRRWAKRVLIEVGQSIESARTDDEEQKAHWDL